MLRDYIMPARGLSLGPIRKGLGSSAINERTLALAAVPAASNLAVEQSAIIGIKNASSSHSVPAYGFRYSADYLEYARIVCQTPPSGAIDLDWAVQLGELPLVCLVYDGARDESARFFVSAAHLLGHQWNKTSYVGVQEAPDLLARLARDHERANNFSRASLALKDYYFSPREVIDHQGPPPPFLRSP